MKIGILILAITWIVCIPLSAGTWNADFRGEFSDNYENAESARRGCFRAWAPAVLGGPIALAVVAIMSDGFRHGWTLECGPVL